MRRYKRFFVDMELDNGSIETAHCPNTGSMLNCLIEGSLCYFSRSDNPRRKLKTSLEYVTCSSGKMACVNTHRANQIVKEALLAENIEELIGYANIASEVKYGEENSRIDFKLSGKDKPDCYVEVKSVTLSGGIGEESIGYFPDAITTRGQKHLRELMAVKLAGHRAVLLFSVQHQGIRCVRPAAHIDAEYARLITEAVENGIEVLAYQALLSPEELRVGQAIPFELPSPENLV